MLDVAVCEVLEGVEVVGGGGAIRVENMPAEAGGGGAVVCAGCGPDKGEGGAGETEVDEAAVGGDEEEGGRCFFAEVGNL